jgi:hypothetical protein
MPDDELISLREFARRIKIDEKIIRRAILSGKIKEGVKDVNGKPKIAYSVALAEANKMGIGLRSPNKSSKPISNKTRAHELPDPADNFDPENELLSYPDALRKKENYVAGIKKLEFLEKQRTLVDKSEVYSQLFEFGKEIRTEFESMPGRVSHKISDLGSDSSKIAETLAIEIQKSLNKVVETLNRKLA